MRVNHDTKLRNEALTTFFFDQGVHQELFNGCKRVTQYANASQKINSQRN